MTVNTIGVVRNTKYASVVTLYVGLCGFFFCCIIVINEPNEKKYSIIDYDLSFN